MIRIAVVDDKINNRMIIKDKLARNSFFNLVMEAVDGEDFLTKIKSLPDDDKPHMVLMDLEMPNVDGVTAIASASSLSALTMAIPALRAKFPNRCRNSSIDL